MIAGVGSGVVRILESVKGFFRDQDVTTLSVLLHESTRVLCITAVETGQLHARGVMVLKPEHGTARHGTARRGAREDQPS